jgi:PKHD-type hydroxylase
MKGEWCYFKSYFSSDYCNSIIEKSKDLTFQTANLGEDGLSSNHSHRKSDVTWLYPQDFPDLYEEMWKLEREANKTWFGFHIDNLEYIQLAKYDGNVKGEYKRHKDVFWVNDNPRHRKLSAVIQLSNPEHYEGGDLSFFECAEYPNPEEIKQQGTVIFFPAFIDHQASPVLKGTRYSMAVWFEGPKWS